jgi:threonine dehydrogenase-like Zn-dependent dehydrogenase
MSLGHLHMLKYLHHQGYDVFLDCRGSAAAAAANGHLPVVKFLYKAAIVSEQMQECEARGGHVEVMAYLYRKQIGDWSAAALKNMLQRAGDCNHLAAAKWLREVGAVWPDQLWEYRSSSTADAEDRMKR